MDDAVAVYRAVIKNRPAAKIVIGGTSAGGGLTLATVHKLKELGLDLPGAVWVGTPWADLTKTSDSLYSNEGARPGPDHLRRHGPARWRASMPAKKISSTR